MTPAEIGYETLDPNSEMSVASDADAGDAGTLEDVDHTGRVVVREVVERRDDTVVDHLPRAVDLAVGVTLAVTHVGLELGAGGTDAPALVERSDRGEQRVLHLGVGREGAGERRDHADLHHWSGAAPRLGGRGDRAARDRHHGREDAEHEEARAPCRTTDRVRAAHSHSSIRAHGSPHGDDRTCGHGSVPPRTLRSALSTCQRCRRLSKCLS